jgi:hypothetical protein
MAFGRLFPKRKGCLYGKTPEQKISFFESLNRFSLTDKQFFKEQYNDMLLSEKAQYDDWLTSAIISKIEVLLKAESLLKKSNSPTYSSAQHELSLSKYRIIKHWNELLDAKHPTKSLSFLPMAFGRNCVTGDGWRTIRYKQITIHLERNPSGYHIYYEGGERVNLGQDVKYEKMCAEFDLRLKM